jgi:hypothetical protein
VNFYKRKLGNILQCLDVERSGLQESKMTEDLRLGSLGDGTLYRTRSSKPVFKVN